MWSECMPILKTINLRIRQFLRLFSLGWTLLELAWENNSDFWVISDLKPISVFKIYSIIIILIIWYRYEYLVQLLLNEQNN